MNKNILIIDDELAQAEGLRTALSNLLPNFTFESVSAEKDILNAIENRYFSLALIDIRMDEYPFNGIQLVERIIEINPFAKVIIMSAFKEEYLGELKHLLLSGRVLDVQQKESLRTWIPTLSKIISEYFEKTDADPSEINNALLQFYADAKNETDTFKKGERFEHFISLLFQSFGYKEIQKRFKDESLNEVDLVIRNETTDSFLNKFGKYILVECKNKPEAAVNKNDFIIFAKKVENTNGLAELGVIATSGYITWNTYIEAIRESGGQKKIIFMSNPEIETLIRSRDKVEEFKRLIDMQVKDNNKLKSK